MKLGRIFAGAALLVLPFIYSTHAAEQVRFPKAQFLVLMAGIYFGIHICRKIDGPLGCAAISLAFFGYLTRLAYPAADQLVLAAAFASCFWVNRPEKHEIQVALKILEVSGLLCAAYAALQHFGHDPLFTLYDWADKTRPSALLGQSTLYGPFAVACLTAALFQRHYISAALLFLPIAAINSSFTFLSLGVVFAVFAYYRFGHKALLGLPVILVSLFLLKFARPHVVEELLDSNGRSALWSITLQIAKHRPTLGYGLGSFRQAFPLFQSAEVRQMSGLADEGLSAETTQIFKKAAELEAHYGRFYSAHNEYLQVFFETGLVGLMVVAAIIWSFAASWLTLPGNQENWCLLAIFLAFLANCIGNFPMHLVPQALLPLWAYVAVTTQRRRSIIQ